MRILPTLAVIAAPVLLTLGGCATADPQFGSAVQNNIIAHAVDLDPVYAGVPIEGGNAARSANAVRQYNNGAVKPLYQGVLGKNTSSPQ
jgi:hypothetical protein